MSANEEVLRDLMRLQALNDRTADMFRHIMVRIPVSEEGVVIDPSNWTRSERANMEGALNESPASFQEEWRIRRALCIKLGIGQFNHTDDVIHPRGTS